MIPHRSTNPYLDALSHFALENGYLVFEAFSVEPDGNIIPHEGKDLETIYLDIAGDTGEASTKKKEAGEKTLALS